MVYITYAIDNYLKDCEYYEDMERLGFDNEDDFEAYLEDERMYQAETKYEKLED